MPSSSATSCSYRRCRVVQAVPRPRARAASWYLQAAGSSDPHSPAWFSAGHYAFATDGSKKRPIILDERDLQERFIRGSGPGGQAINKLSTNVELVHIPTHTRVTCQHTRSRQQNREIARRLMSQRLEWLIKQSWHPRAGVSVLQARIDKIRQRKYHKRKKQHRSVVT